ncbi:tetratricopeptide repeat protein [Streptomyces sp. NPDC101151]|uniref:tetratricopeptide repeat protein n=1 Tax=Streptomyces sp. NPDC101151 TaxID=3366115 RepID=UPI0038180E3C
MGGVGKTALVLEAAHQACARGWFPGGALFVDLRGYDDIPIRSEQAVLALLDGLGVQGPDLPMTVTAEWEESSVPMTRYQMHLSRHRPRTLLVLDNASSPRQFLPLVPASGEHGVLVTSRDRPDSVPFPLVGLEPLSEDESTALVTSALHIADPNDDRPAQEPGTLRQLTSLCGHLPLTLHIAAAMLRRRRHRDIASLVTEIKRAGDPTRVLDAGSRGPDQYGRSLAVRPVLETSYRRLQPAQARMLRLLALAPGADADAEAVGALTGLDGETALDLLEALNAAGLVTAVTVRGDVRWRVHDLVRAFGAGLVAADPGSREEGEAARARLLAFYHECVAAADDRLRWLPGRPEPKRFTDRATALAWLDAERTGLVEAVQWAPEKRHARRAVELAESLAAYLAWRRCFDDWITVSRTAVKAARQAGDLLSEAAAWDGLGTSFRETGLMSEAIEAHARARDLFAKTGDRRREAASWNNLGSALQADGRTAQAIEALTRARQLHQDVEDRRHEATSWNNLGVALQTARRLDDAVAAHTRARRLFQDAHDHNGEGIALNNLGLALERTGRATDAMDLYGNASTMLRNTEDWYRTGQTLRNLALAQQDALQWDEARATYLEAAGAFTRADAPAEAAEAQSHADTLT